MLLYSVTKKLIREQYLNVEHIVKYEATENTIVNYNYQSLMYSLLLLLYYQHDF